MMEAGELPLTRWRDLRTMFLALLVLGIIMHTTVWLMATSGDKDRDAWYAYLRDENIGAMFKKGTTKPDLSRDLSTRLGRTGVRVSTVKLEDEHDMLNNLQTQNLSDPEMNVTESRQVLILSYQRSGSTYIGALLGQLPGMFYVYEPLDSLYMALYGTAEGWNVPTDITNYSNGTARPLPSFEIKAVSTFLDHMINCRTSSLPTETFHHRFWSQFKDEQRSLAAAYSCLNRLLVGSENCARLLRGVCSERFNSSQEGANNLCHGNIMRMRHELHQLDGMNMSRDAFRRHEDCLLADDNAVVRCKYKLQLLCLKSATRVVKTVRLTMQSVETLIRNNPGIKIVHLIRDPRGVMLSRSKLLSTYGLYSELLPRNIFADGYVDYAKHNRIDGGRIAKPGKMDFQREAKMFCNTLYNDLTLRHRLEVSYPNVFHQVIFDDFVKDPVINIQKLYSFVGADPEIGASVGFTGINSSSIAVKWRREMSKHTATSIRNTCRRVYKLVNSPSWNI